MKGKVVLITGATRGIGRAGAFAMAKAGASLILIGRDQEKLAQVAQACLQAGAAEAKTFKVDLISRKSVAELGRSLVTSGTRLDVLWNNAGAYFTERRVTEEGWERTWAMNQLAYFDLTRALFPLLEKSNDPRVICTSSEAHRWARMKWDNLNGETSWNGWQAYCRSKLANLLFVAEQGRRLGNSPIRICAAHPGLVNSALGDENRGLAGMAFLWLKHCFGKSNEQGAETEVWLASRPERPSQGAYYANRKEREPSRAARDQADARRLWKECETRR